MSEFELKRDKTKAFKASQKNVDAINELIKSSGKNDSEFFEDLVNDLLIKGLVDDKNETISVDLRKHFESDVQKLKNATNSIMSIFVSQMENVSVEKNMWEATTEKKLLEKQEELEKQVEQHTELKQKVDASKLALTELTKINESFEKERDALAKRTLDQEQLIQDRAARIEELSEQLNKRNETIIAKDEQLEQFSTLVEEKKTLNDEIAGLRSEIKQLTEGHADALKKQKEELIFSCEKEKYAAERDLIVSFQIEKEVVRNETRKETEVAIREFYLKEIKRKDQEAAAREKALQLEIEKLQKELKLKEEK